MFRGEKDPVELSSSVECSVEVARRFLPCRRARTAAVDLAARTDSRSIGAVGVGNVSVDSGLAITGSAAAIAVLRLGAGSTMTKPRWQQVSYHSLSLKTDAVKYLWETSDPWFALVDEPMTAVMRFTGGARWGIQRLQSLKLNVRRQEICHGGMDASVVRRFRRE